MNKIKKVSFAILMLIVLVITSSCVKRRIEQLQLKKDASSQSGKPSVYLVDNFNPDKITEYTIEQYLKWYKNLKAPPQLQLPAYENPKKLSQSDMVKDFNYLFEELKENYPFFQVLKRKYDIDFLANYDQYLRRVKECKTDKEFIDTLTEIMNDLNNYHAKIADKEYVKQTLEYYSQNWNQPSIYYEFINLNRQQVRNRYGLDGLQSQQGAGQINRKRLAVFTKDKKSNISFESMGDLAILKINQMIDDGAYGEDEEVLNEFLKDKHLYKGLIIDIRDNAGGNMEYWQNFLLPRLILNPKQVTNHMFFKESERAKLILADNTLNIEKLSNVDITGIKLDHAEDLENFDYYIKDTIKINPDESKRDYGYEGKIFILVNKGVFSAAEGLASFAKYTETATLVGEQTGGDGITLGVINSVLPQSGLVFTYTNTLGYTPDGTINQENPTTPDIEVDSYRQALDTIQMQVR